MMPHDQSALHFEPRVDSDRPPDWAAAGGTEDE
jgi:hypothetical protein